ncbi:hypothetical protein [Burkholderia anthina]
MDVIEIRRSVLQCGTAMAVRQDWRGFAAIVPVNRKSRRPLIGE